jgi:hypothetical protein
MGYELSQGFATPHLPSFSRATPHPTPLEGWWCGNRTAPPCPAPPVPGVATTPDEGHPHLFAFDLSNKMPARLKCWVHNERWV